MQQDGGGPVQRQERAVLFFQSGVDDRQAVRDDYARRPWFRPPPPASHDVRVGHPKLPPRLVFPRSHRGNASASRPSNVSSARERQIPEREAGIHGSHALEVRDGLLVSGHDLLTIASSRRTSDDSGSAAKASSSSRAASSTLPVESASRSYSRCRSGGRLGLSSIARWKHVWACSQLRSRERSRPMAACARPAADRAQSPSRLRPHGDSAVSDEIRSSTLRSVRPSFNIDRHERVHISKPCIRGSKGGIRFDDLFEQFRGLLRVRCAPAGDDGTSRQSQFRRLADWSRSAAAPAQRQSSYFTIAFGISFRMARSSLTRVRTARPQGNIASDRINWH